MWFRRLFRRRRQPPPLDLSALDRLEELIARVVALVPEVRAARPSATALPAAAPTLSTHELPAAAHLLFLPGYELVEKDGPAPGPRARIEHGGRTYFVLRHGPSPFPDDERRCAYLEKV